MTRVQVDWLSLLLSPILVVALMCAFFAARAAKREVSRCLAGRRPPRAWGGPRDVRRPHPRGLGRGVSGSPGRGGDGTGMDA
ncbi:hypothetical protein NKH77_01740 [Streptomyces sp. M19]